MPLPDAAAAVVPFPAAGGAMQGQQQAQPDIQQHRQLLDWMKATNIADDLDDTILNKIGERVKREFSIDETSRSDWKTKTETAMDLAMQVAKEKQYPWPKAANVIFPLMTTASMQFAARAYPAIVSNRNVVKGVVIGSDDGQPQIGPDGQPLMQPGPDGQPQIAWAVPPGAKQVRADQIGEHMSWQLLDEQPEWEPETDMLLHILPIVGCAFRKSFFDPGKGRNCSLMVSAMNLVVNYHAKSLETAPRLTEIIKYYPLEIEEMERSGVFRKPTVAYGKAPDSADDEDAPHVFLEQHRYWDLDEDGYPEPYIVTIHKETSQVVRIVARYEAEGIHISRTDHRIQRIEPVHYYTKYDFIPNPDGGIYSVGFGQLLRPINEAINTTLNMMLDAGHLQTAGGGFIGKGLSMQAGSMRFTLGEYKTVNVNGGTLRENLVPIQAPGPSAVLFELLGLLIEAGKDIAAVKDVLTGDQQKGNVPATTTLALIEQGLKVFTAIYKRVHRALKAELAKLYRLNRVYMNDTAQYKVGNEWRQIAKNDYVVGSGVEPVSDPTMVSDMQKLGRAQFLGGFMNDPWFNGREIRHRMLDAASIEGIDKLLLQQPPPNPGVAVKGMELEQKGHEIEATVNSKRAASLRDLSQAILNLANADATVGDQHIAWLDHQLQAWQAEYEANSGPTGPDQTGGGNPPASIPGMASSPRQQPVLPIPQGQGSVPAGGGLAAMAGRIANAPG